MTIIIIIFDGRWKQSSWARDWMIWLLIANGWLCSHYTNSKPTRATIARPSCVILGGGEILLPPPLPPWDLIPKAQGIDIYLQIWIIHDAVAMQNKSKQQHTKKRRADVGAPKNHHLGASPRVRRGFKGLFCAFFFNCQRQQKQKQLAVSHIRLHLHDSQFTFGVTQPTWTHALTRTGRGWVFSFTQLLDTRPNKRRGSIDLTASAAYVTYNYLPQLTGLLLWFLNPLFAVQWHQIGLQFDLEATCVRHYKDSIARAHRSGRLQTQTFFFWCFSGTWKRCAIIKGKATRTFFYFHPSPSSLAAAFTAFTNETLTHRRVALGARLGAARRGSVEPLDLCAAVKEHSRVLLFKGFNWGRVGRRRRYTLLH